MSKWRNTASGDRTMANWDVQHPTSRDWSNQWHVVDTDNGEVVGEFDTLKEAKAWCEAQ